MSLRLSPLIASEQPAPATGTPLGQTSWDTGAMMPWHGHTALEAESRTAFSPSCCHTY